MLLIGENNDQHKLLDKTEPDHVGELAFNRTLNDSAEDLRTAQDAINYRPNYTGIASAESINLNALVTSTNKRKRRFKENNRIMPANNAKPLFKRSKSDVFSQTQTPKESIEIHR